MSLNFFLVILTLYRNFEGNAHETAQKNEKKCYIRGLKLIWQLSTG
jgi:hypothetical protein